MRAVLIVATVAAVAAFANHWAGRANAARVDPWLEATSPRTAQTYYVRAQADHGELRAFTLEAGDTYRFHACPVPTPGDAVRCADQAGTLWSIEP